MAELTGSLSSAFEHYDAAIAFLRARVPMTDTEFAGIVEASHRTAFAMANVQQAHVVQDVWDSLVEGMSNGEGVDAIARRIRGPLTAAWGGENPVRVNTIVRNAVQSSYNAARWEQMSHPAILAGRPYRMFDAIEDARTSDICSGFDGVIMAADDPRWDGMVPPLHHQCRSTVRSLSRRQVERLGGPKEPPEGASAADGFGALPGTIDQINTGADSLSATLYGMVEVKNQAL